ncbi:MAG: multicopper oxidase domain-containing protein [Actinobacteria bacterium]|nr:multicopper oxidase domain-containing protein [Actinomycetota bacterium]
MRSSTSRLTATVLAGWVAVAAGLVHAWLAAQHVAGSLPWGVAFAAAAALLVATGRRLTAEHTTRDRAAAAAVAIVVAAAFVASRTLGVLVHGHGGWDVLGVVTTLAELAVAGVALGGRRRVRPLGATTALVLAITLAVPQLATAAGNPPAGCTKATRTIHLTAYELPRAADGSIRLGWGTRPDDPGSASIPGPLIELIEGDCVDVSVTNRVPAATLEELRDRYPQPHGTPLGVSLHVHGVKYTASSDGTAHTGSWVPPGETRTYTWYAAPRVVTAGRVTSMGTAGYWWYHDHVAGTSHGTGGLDAGLFGGVVVRRPTDVLRPDRSFTTVFGPGLTIHCGATTITASGSVRTSPDPCLEARTGERVEIVAFGVGHDFHTFHLHGHTWAANRTGILTGVDDETPLIDARTLGPSESFGFQIVAGESVGAGRWMLHCHVQSHSDAGMVAFLDVSDGPTSGLPATHSH